MSENVSPNPMRRKLTQTKLCFANNNLVISVGPTLGLKSKPSKKKSKPPMSTKRIKVEDEPTVDPCVELEESIEIIESESVSEADPRLQEVNDVSNTDEMIVTEEEPISALPLQQELELIEDCSQNGPTLKALKTVKELKEDCISFGLVLDEELYEDCSDDETQHLATDSGGGDFEVEAILDSRRESDGLTYYLVKWKNWSEEYNTWEPLSNLMSCRKLVDEFSYIKSNSSEEMAVYQNFYKLKGIIEDVVERKIPFDVMTSILLVFNDIRLKDFSYTKTFINKMRSELRDRQLSNIDKISGIVKVERRVDKMTALYHKLIEELNVLKRFETFEMFYEFFIKRKQTEFRLNRWENDINDIIIKQNEGQTIRVENFIDCDIPPSGFEYISHCKTVDPNIEISDDPPLYCECNDCEQEVKKCCVSTYTASIHYTKNAILKDSRNNRNPIYECNKSCKCDQNCINRVVQKGRKHKLAIFRTDDGRGWGVRALEPIDKGSYVMEYVGEIISVDEADRRGHIYDAEGRTYLFDLDYTPDVNNKYTLDATQCGNVSHFVNHSCDPNLDTRVVWINNLDPFMPHIALFAVRKIKLNEELTFDYKINVHGITDADQSQSKKELSINSDKSDDSGIEGNCSDGAVIETSAETSGTTEAKPPRVACRCGAYNCRKYLY